MQISRELLEAKRAEAIAERDRLLSQANAQIGAINVLEHLLQVLALPEPPVPAPKP